MQCIAIWFNPGPGNRLSGNGGQGGEVPWGIAVERAACIKLLDLCSSGVENTQTRVISPLADLPRPLLSTEQDCSSRTIAQVKCKLAANKSESRPINLQLGIQIKPTIVCPVSV